MRMMRTVMKVCMNIITMTGDWWMRNVMKFIALCNFSMVAMMTMMAMMAMIMVDLSLLDNMLAISFITGQQKVGYCLF